MSLSTGTKGYFGVTRLAYITSGQSNLTTGRIAAVHVRFNGFRQVVPVCTTTQYMLPWANPSP